MPALISSRAVRTCHGDGRASFAAMVAGRSGAGPARQVELPVAAYEVRGLEGARRAEALLRGCLEQVRESGPLERGIPVFVGTGMGGFRGVEAGWVHSAEDLNFDRVVREVLPGSEVVTVSDACSASGHALALALDRIELGECEVAIAAGVDAPTAAMLAMNLRVSDPPADRVRPFDVARSGAVLGEGAAAVVLRRDRGERLGDRVLSVGLSCDAKHLTAPDPDGIVRAISDALQRAGLAPAAIDFVVAHGTGTALNGRVEAACLERVFGPSGPPISAIKGAIGHTSGAAALHSLDAGLRAVHSGTLPGIVGLVEPGPSGDFVLRPRAFGGRRFLVNAFGFGGVNAVAVVEGAG